MIDLAPGRTDVRARVTAACLVIAALGVLGVAVATRWGPGLSPDSAWYIGGASGLLSGKGLVMPRWADAETFPITHFPPVYPALIAMVSSTGASPMSAARWINAVLFGANVFLIGILVHRAGKTVRAPWWLGPTAALFASTSPPLFFVHSMAWSEPAFIFLWLVGIVALTSYQRTSRRSLLLASAACAGLGVLARYAGIPVVPATVIVLLFFSVHSVRRRIADAVVYVTVALIPIAVWLIRNLSVGGTATNRTMSWQPLDSVRLVNGLEVLSSWLYIPQGFLPVVVTLMIVLTVAGIATTVTLREALASATVTGTGEGAVAVAVVGVFALLYLAFLGVSITFFDHQTRLDRRILSPVFVAALVTLLHGFALASRGRKRLVRHAMTALVCLLAARYGLGGLRSAHAGYQHGIGFNDVTWRQSEVLQAIARLPAEFIVYSNRPEVIFLHMGRPAANLPAAADIANLESRMRTTPSVIAYFRRVERVWMPTEQDLLARLPLRVLAAGTDGGVYGLE